MWNAIAAVCCPTPPNVSVSYATRSISVETTHASLADLHLSESSLTVPRSLGRNNGGIHSSGFNRFLHFINNICHGLSVSKALEKFIKSVTLSSAFSIQYLRPCFFDKLVQTLNVTVSTRVSLEDSILEHIIEIILLNIYSRKRILRLHGKTR